MSQYLIRARQIRALYQRELTSLHRNPNVNELARMEHVRRLWQQAVNQLAEMHRAAEQEQPDLTEDQRAVFAPPERPHELDGR